jgi:hypothetical protein
MNKPIILMALALASVEAAGVLAMAGSAYAQYGGDQGVTTTTPTPQGGTSGTASQAQVQECQQLGITASECNDNNILAKRRLIAAQQNPSTGSGTPMLTTNSGQMIAFVVILGAIFGGVAAAFFLKGRGSKPVTT